MSDISIFTGQTGPAQRRESALAQQLVSSSKNKTRRIQANINGTFKKLVNGEQVGAPIRGEFNAIVVGMLTDVSRTYYKEKFDPNKEATLPNCWSNNGDKPEAGALDPQHKNCADCPMNVKGSGENGGRACRFQRRVSLMLEGDDSGTVYQFNIPAKSLFGKGTGNIHPFESYVKFLVNNGMSPDLVVTNISFDSNAETMELMFSPLREVSDGEYELVIAAQARPETEMYTKLTAAQADGVKQAPKLEKPVPAIARSEEPEEEPAEELDEPVKRSNKKEEAPKLEEDSLASIIDEWGSDDA
tara:strand:- start:6321 stop:7223 length:903 start_codon:yes stop_codon:yes gene_type:complete